MHKGLLQGIIAVLLLILLTNLAGFAAGGEETPLVETLETEEIFPQDTAGLFQEVTEIPLPETFASAPAPFANGEKTFAQTLGEGCLARRDGIDVLEYGITVAQMRTIFYNFSMMHPELFIGTGYSYVRENYLAPKEEWDDIRDKIYVLFPIYLCDGTELRAKQDGLREDIAQYVNLAKAQNTPLEGLLAVHDQLVTSCVYDTPTANKVNADDPLTEEEYFSFHADGLFSNGKAVCQGYAQAFYAIAKELGYEVNYCANNGHIWNYIKLDGEWYHIDVTWDDPVPDVKGKAGHRYFLRADETMKDHYPSEWVTPLRELPACTSTKYQSGYFFNLPGMTQIEKTEGKYHAEISGITLYADKLKSTLAATQPQDGKIRYIYLQNPDKPVEIFTRHQNSRGVGQILRTTREEETMYHQGSIALYTYTLPKVSGTSPGGNLFFWDMETLTPVGPAIAFP